MLGSINPLGERARGSRWGVTVAALAVGAVAGGGAIGVVLGGAGHVLLGSVSPVARVAALAGALVAGAAFDGRRRGLRRPSIRRQVNEDWLGRYRGGGGRLRGSARRRGGDGGHDLRRVRGPRRGGAHGVTARRVRGGGHVGGRQGPGRAPGGPGHRPPRGGGPRPADARVGATCPDRRSRGPGVPRRGADRRGGHVSRAGVVTASGGAG